MKRKISLLIICFLSINFLSISKASNSLNLEEFLTIYGYGISQGINNNWEGVKLKYDGLKKSSHVYKALQKAIYVGYLPNMNVELPLDAILTPSQTIKLLKLDTKKFYDYLSGDRVDTTWTIELINLINQDIKNNQKAQESIIFEDIKNRLKENYIYQDKLNRNNNYDSIKDYIKILQDDYTVFFPKNDAKEFNDSVNGSFEGIGAYINIIAPGKIIIESPLKGSPAEKYGVKAGDIILKVDNHIVTEHTSTNELINWVKGPEGTYVELLVKRGSDEILLKIKRGEIILPNIEYKILDGNNCYININQFNQQSRLEFGETIDFFENKNCSKYIFDIRNNPGGILEDVGYIINYFVPDKKIGISIKYKDATLNMIANHKTKKLFDENIIVLINEGTASASEIFALTIRDYVKNNLILGTSSFGKGSVQNLVEYSNGSMLKYTVAKWYSGKSQTNIDGKGIKPDFKMEDNINTKKDELIEVAKMYKFLADS